MYVFVLFMFVGGIEVKPSLLKDESLCCCRKMASELRDV